MKKKESEYKIYEGNLRDILQQCLNEGRRPLTLFETVTLRNQKKIPQQYYHTGTVECTTSGRMFDASVMQLKRIIKEKDVTKWRAWCIFNLDGMSDALGLNYLSLDDGRLVGVKSKKQKESD